MTATDRNRRRLRRRFGVGVAILVVIAGLAGCGVSESGPVDVGDAAVAGILDSGGTVRTPPTAESANGPDDLVSDFLRAAVGGNETARKRVEDFLTPAARASWQPRQDLTIVRILSSGPATSLGGGHHRVTVRYQPIGILNDNGSVSLVNQQPVSFDFEVVKQGDEWRLSRAPSGMMISERTLGDYYRPTSIYFWDQNRIVLVPDQRYLPLTMPVEQRPNQVVQWLLGGPSDLLRGAVWRFNPGTALKRPIVLGSWPLVVNLTSAAVGDDLVDQQRLVDQLRWSMLPYVNGPIELQIEGQRKDVDGVSDHFRNSNASAAPRPIELFGVSDARRVVAKSGPAAGQPLPILTAKANDDVRYAAITVDHRLGAYVQAGPAGTSLTVAMVQEGGPVRESRPIVRDFGRPVWIPAAPDVLLVPASGKLYLVNTAGRADPVALSVSGRVESIAIAPDGRRIAVVAGGKAYVGALIVDQASVSVGELRQLVPGLLQPAAVAWMSEDTVLVAGDSAGRARLFGVGADGVNVRDYSPRDEALINQALTDVVALPSPPGSLRGEIVVQTSSADFYVFVNSGTASPADVRSPFYPG